MKVIFSPRARNELREIQIYIAFDNVAVAARVASRIRGAISILEYHPKIAELYKGGPERRLVVPGYPYCVYYDVDERAEEVNVLTIQHTSRRPQPYSRSCALAPRR